MDRRIGLACPIQSAPSAVDGEWAGLPESMPTGASNYGVARWSGTDSPRWSAVEGCVVPGPAVPRLGDVSAWRAVRYPISVVKPSQWLA